MRFSNSCFFSHKLVVPSPLIHTLKYFHNLLQFYRVIGQFLNLHVSIQGYFWISEYWNTQIKKFLCFIHGDFWISVFQNMEIGKYEQFCLTKPPCFNTRIFLNLRVLKHKDSKISVFKPWRFLNLLALKHRD